MGGSTLLNDIWIKDIYIMASLFGPHIDGTARKEKKSREQYVLVT